MQQMQQQQHQENSRNNSKDNQSEKKFPSVLFPSRIARQLQPLKGGGLLIPASALTGPVSTHSVETTNSDSAKAKIQDQESARIPLDRTSYWSSKERNSRKREPQEVCRSSSVRLVARQEPCLWKRGHPATIQNKEGCSCDQQCFDLPRKVAPQRLEAFAEPPHSKRLHSATAWWQVRVQVKVDVFGGRVRVTCDLRPRAHGLVPGLSFQHGWTCARLG